MSKKSTSLVVLLCLILAGTTAGQDSTYKFTVQTLGGYTTPGVVPFWLRSNQFGSIPLDGALLSMIGAARKDYDLSGDKLFDWGASLEGRTNLGQGSNLTLIEGYGKVRLGIFELRAGRSKKITGLCDSTLSSGSWAISGTNLGIPEVELSVREFWTLPWTGELFALKGNFSHGWMGYVPMNRWFEGGDTVQVITYLHQKSLYGRFGKPSWKFKLYGGFNHQVVWCDENVYYTRDFDLSLIDTYFYVLTGKRYNNGFIESTRLGNHIGSIDVGLELDFKRITLLFYRQNFYDGGALSALANIQDGLNGFGLTNLQVLDNALNWKKINFEFLYTKNQAGEPWSPEYGSFYENYYNHGEYFEGWSYKDNGLGSPFVTPRTQTRNELPNNPIEYFSNNRLWAIHLGSEGGIFSFDYLIKISWSKNFGTYMTTDDEQSTGLINPGVVGLFGENEQLSAYLELNRELANGFRLGFLGAIDHGTLLYNSLGLFLKASYSFEL